MLKNSQKIKTIENPLSLLQSKDVLEVLKKHWTFNHENLIDPEKFVEDFFAEIATLTSNREINKLYQKKLKAYRNPNLDLQKPRDMFLEIIKQELLGVETVLDFGCGKLAFLKNIAEKNNNIRKLIGVDSRSQPDLEDLDGRIIFFRNLEEVENSSVDLVVVKLVLHHLDDEQTVQDIFSDLKRVLHPSGKLIVFEESFPDAICDLTEVRKNLSEFKLELSEATADFLQLTREDRIKFLFLNDWLMNLQNTYMPWTLQYKSMEEWRDLIESVGFREKEARFLGAIKHRKRKQGMTAELIFSR
jgi:ubiquinone/menaquinone biosynthesis C-methylase UbiE